MRSTMSSIERTLLGCHMGLKAKNDLNQAIKYKPDAWPSVDCQFKFLIKKDLGTSGSEADRQGVP